MVLSIATISKNRLLVACADGLYELAIDGSNYKYTKLETNDKNASVKHNSAYSICFWKEDNYFVSTSDGVLLYSSKTGKTQKF